MNYTPKQIVNELDKYIVGNGTAGSFTTSLHKYYLDAARGFNKDLLDWLTPIY